MHKKTAHFFGVLVHILEYVIAAITLIVLIGLVGLEVYKMFTLADYFSSADTYLHNMLTIVVGLEFVRMLTKLTPANTIEVLIVAIARQIIILHDDPLTNIACVLCIAGLFAIRRFLISKTELKMELSDSENDTSNNT